jgi:hypothetical protein
VLIPIDVYEQGLDVRDELLQRHAFGLWRRSQTYYRQAAEEARVASLEQSGENWITLRRLVKSWRSWRRGYRGVVFEQARKNVSGLLLFMYRYSGSRGLGRV